VYHGIVVSWDLDKEVPSGFIRPHGYYRDVYFNRHDTEPASWMPRIQDKVEFEVVSSDTKASTAGVVAVNVGLRQHDRSLIRSPVRAGGGGGGDAATAHAIRADKKEPVLVTSGKPTAMVTATATATATTMVKKTDPPGVRRLGRAGSAFFLPQFFAFCLERCRGSV